MHTTCYCFVRFFLSSVLTPKDFSAHLHIHILLQGWAIMGPFIQVRRSKKLISSRSLRLVLSYCLALRMGWFMVIHRLQPAASVQLFRHLIRRVITRPVLNESQLQHVFAGDHSGRREVSWPQNINQSMLWTYPQCLTPLLIDYSILYIIISYIYMIL